MLMPTLSPSSWISDTQELCDYLFSLIYLTNKSQSEIYNGNIISMAAIIQENNNNIPQTIEKLSGGLRSYFGRYFKNVDVTVKQNAANRDSRNGQVILEIYVNVTDDDNKQFSIGKLFTIENSLISKVQSVINS